LSPKGKIYTSIEKRIPVLIVLLHQGFHLGEGGWFGTPAGTYQRRRLVGEKVKVLAAV